MFVYYKCRKTTDDRKQIYENSDVVIICFAIDNPQSFKNVKEKVSTVVIY